MTAECLSYECGASVTRSSILYVINPHTQSNNNEVVRSPSPHKQLHTNRRGRWQTGARFCLTWIMFAKLAAELSSGAYGGQGTLEAKRLSTYPVGDVVVEDMLVPSLRVKQAIIHLRFPWIIDDLVLRAALNEAKTTGALIEQTRQEVDPDQQAGILAAWTNQIVFPPLCREHASTIADFENALLSGPPEAWSEYVLENAGPEFTHEQLMSFAGNARRVRGIRPSKSSYGELWRAEQEMAHVRAVLSGHILTRTHVMDGFCGDLPSTLVHFDDGRGVSTECSTQDAYARIEQYVTEYDQQLAGRLCASLVAVEGAIRALNPDRALSCDDMRWSNCSTNVFAAWGADAGRDHILRGFTSHGLYMSYLSLFLRYVRSVGLNEVWLGRAKSVEVPTVKTICECSDVPLGNVLVTGQVAVIPLCRSNGAYDQDVIDTCWRLGAIVHDAPNTEEALREVWSQILGTATKAGMPGQEIREGGVGARSGGWDMQAWDYQRFLELGGEDPTIELAMGRSAADGVFYDQAERTIAGPVMCGKQALFVRLDKRSRREPAIEIAGERLFPMACREYCRKQFRRFVSQSLSRVHIVGLRNDVW